MPINKKQNEFDTLVQCTTNGDFKEALVLIENGAKPTLGEQDVLKLFVASCNACLKFKENPGVLVGSEIQQFLSSLLGCIKEETVGGSFMKRYLQSIYYICSFLTSQKNLNVVIQMEAVIIPRFLPSTLSSELKEIYEGLSTTFYNALLAAAKTKEINAKNAVGFSKLIMRICKYCDVVYYASLLHKCGNCLNSLEVNITEQKKFFEDGLIQLEEHDGNRKVFSYVIKCFINFVNNLTKVKDMEEVQRIIKIAELYLHHSETKLLLSVLKSYISMFFTSDNKIKLSLLKEVENNFDLYLKHYGFTSSVEIVYSFIYSLSVVFINDLKADATKWSKTSVEVQLKTFALFSSISKTLMQNCKEINHLSTKLILCLVYLCKLYVNKEQVSNAYLENVMTHLEHFLMTVSNLPTSKDSVKINEWKEIKPYIYNIGICVFNRSNYEQTLICLIPFIEYELKFEKAEHLSDSLNCALSQIIEAYLNKKNIEKAVFYCSLLVAVGKINNYNFELGKWIKIKLLAKESGLSPDFQKLSVCDILEKNNDKIKSYGVNCSINIEEKIKLLVIELKYYSTKWKSKIPMMAVYRKLYEIADIQTSVKVLQEVWGFTLFQADDSFVALMTEILNHYNVYVDKNSNQEDLLYLAYLYFINFKYSMKQLIVKQRLVKTDGLSKNVNNELNEPNDEWDIVSSYESLQLDETFKMLTYLNKCKDILVQLKNISVNNSYHLLYEILMMVAAEYRLQCISLSSAQMLHLAMNIAEIGSTARDKLHCMAFLMQSLEPETASEILKRGDELLKDCEKTDFEVIYYLVEKAFVLMSRDSKTSEELLNKAMDLVDQVKSPNERLLLKIRLSFLHFKLCSLPCSLAVKNHMDYQQVRLLEALLFAVDLFNKGIGSAQELCVFFDIHQAVIEYFDDLRLPREVRCYAKEVILVSQKMILPIRTANLLTVLANSDLLSCRYDDCNVKLHDLADILYLSYSQNSSSEIVRDVKNEELAEDIEPFEAVRDVMTKSESVKIVRRIKSEPKIKEWTSSNPSSPLLEVPHFKCPSFVYHERGCQCFHCSCDEYHNLVILKTLLQGLFYLHKNMHTLSESYFSGALKLYQMCCKKSESNLTGSNNIYNVNSKIKKERIKVYCRILLNYAFLYYRLNSVNKALHFNKELLSEISTNGKPLELIHLYNEGLVQRMDFLNAKEGYGENSTKDFLQVQDGSISEPQKTPEHIHNKFPQLTFSGRKPLLPRVCVKAIKFDLSDSEAIERPVSPHTSVMDKLFANYAKTPKPKADKPIKKEMIPLTPIRTISDANKENQPSNLDEITPCCKKKPNSKFGPKTKILSERIKKKNVPSIIIDNDEKSEALPRKLEKQVTANDGQQCLKIRRSTRNNKKQPTL